MSAMRGAGGLGLAGNIRYAITFLSHAEATASDASANRNRACTGAADLRVARRPNDAGPPTGSRADLRSRPADESLCTARPARAGTRQAWPADGLPRARFSARPQAHS